MIKRYACTTVIQPMARIRRRRMLPKAGEVNVRNGQEVTAVQVLARAPLTTHFYIVPLSEKLGVDPEAASEYMLVSTGEQVSQGTILAERSRLIGRKQIESPLDGEFVSLYKGRAILRQTSDWLELRSLVAGRVVNAIGNRGVLLEVIGARLQGVWSSGEATMGELRNVANGPDALLQPEQISSELANCVVVAGRLQNPDLLPALVESGVRGVIAGSMSAELCAAAVSARFPILLTEGIGQQRMAGPIFDLLQEVDGEDASLFGDVAEGDAERPEVIIPRPGVPTAEAPVFHKPLAAGQQVRILRAPYENQTGVIETVYERMRLLPNHVAAHGARVRLGDGQQVFVAAANLDVLIA